MTTMNRKQSKLPRLDWGTAWVLGWLALAAWFGFGREWMRQSPTPAMAIVTPKSSASVSKVSLTKPAKIEAVAISQMRVGDQVPANNPIGDKDYEFGDTVDPPNWRKLTLLATKTDGTFADVQLLRPLWWLEEQKAEVGRSLLVEFPECGITGPSELLAIEPCPQIKIDPDFRVVTGVFKHDASKIIDVYVEGIVEPIGTTPNHPFYSTDRNAFVRADELREGERLKSFAGNPRVVRIVELTDSEPVYNLEVQCDHVFHIAASGVLVHNSTPCPKDIALGLREGLDNFLGGVRGVPWWNWRQAGLTTGNPRNLNAFGETFQQAATNARSIHFNLSGFDTTRAMSAPKDWLANNNLTNMEFRAILDNAGLLEKTKFYIDGKVFAQGSEVIEKLGLLIP